MYDNLLIAMSLRDIATDWSANTVQVLINNLINNSELLEELERSDKTMNGGLLVGAGLDLRDVLMNHIPGGLSMGNFYVVSYSGEPNHTLIITTYPHQRS